MMDDLRERERERERGLLGLLDQFFLRKIMVKAHRRKLRFSERSPQFFKLYLPNLCSLRLRIPPAFVKYFDGVLPHKSTITSSAKRWQVNMNQVNDDLYFDKGWKQFVQDNSLEFGDFLIFYYGGNAKFYVKIYGKNGCQKEVTNPTGETHQENETIDHSKSCQIACRTSSKKVIRKKHLSPRVPNEIQEDDIDRELRDKFKSKFPFFRVVMSSTYLKRGIMNIPASFLKSYVEKDRESVTLLSSDKLWPVKLVRYLGTGILAGWHAKPAERKLLRKISPRGPMEIQDDIERDLKKPANSCPNFHSSKFS
ncbi:hypothetical protein TEA_008229 [Camellia sinensis var. sinensis]|uniref:TF-B3 domain-containing protein n=1 Tax=Camellia sinensis var. sinensis TaxID=542762 RepID=A0A4S4ECI1_CAMSN|nr:hypothetical protein TEA_008229 [Camellia sinensis var. sinensis]